jgi:hypothetical protein
MAHPGPKAFDAAVLASLRKRPATATEILAHLYAAHGRRTNRGTFPGRLLRQVRATHHLLGHHWRQASMNLSDQKFLRAVGERPRDRRLALKWGRRELARRCELHRTFVGAVERGERNVSVLNLRLLARVPRVPLAELLDGLA